MIEKNLIATHMKSLSTTVFFCILLAVVSAGAKQQARESDASPDTVWQKLSQGLELGFLPSPQPSETGDQLIRLAIRVAAFPDDGWV